VEALTPNGPEARSARRRDRRQWTN